MRSGVDASTGIVRMRGMVERGSVIGIGHGVGTGQGEAQKRHRKVIT